MHELGGHEIGPPRRTSDGGADPQSAAGDAQPTIFWRSNSDSWQSDLSRVIEGQIIPRLLLAHSTEHVAEPVADARAELDIAAFAECLLTGTPELAWDRVTTLQQNGYTLATILLEFLAPAARRLGSLWETDQKDFIDVTVGLNRLTEMLRRLTPENEGLARPDAELRRALLLPTPGEAHVFGVNIVEMFFRCAGWQVHRGGEDFADVLGAESFDFVGFSLSAVRHFDRLRGAVTKARKASLNHSMLVLVGGSIFAEDASLAAQVGADATAVDAPSAVFLAQSLFRRRAAI